MSAMRADVRERSVRAAVLAIAGVCVLAAAARAQPAAEPPSDTGYLGRAAAPLEIDDCPQLDPNVSQEQLKAQGSERYQRAATLYEQGDYPGAAREFISAYCVGKTILTPEATGAILKGIGQAHERNLDYEKAIGYFERYLRDLPPAGAPDKQVFESRILVLQKLRAQVLVETEPKGAQVTISNESGVAGLGKSGKPIEVPGGSYTMLVELPGHEPHTQPIEVRIGKPFAFFVPLRPLRGRLSAQIAPADAKVFLRDKAVERFVGIGRVDEVLTAGTYVLVAEAADRIKVERPVEVLPNRVNRMQIDLPLKPQFGRRQLVVFSAVGGAFVTGGALYAVGDDTITGLGILGGIGAGLVGSMLYLPEDVPLGTSNLTITAGLAGTVAGTTVPLLFTSSQRIGQPIQAMGTLLGAGIGYYVGSRTDITPGAAALINSSAFWGTAAGGLFALSFGDDRTISAGLVLSGLGMGTASGILMTRYFEVSRRRAILIDVGGLVGAIGGLAAESLAFPVTETGAKPSREHIANFTLGGMAIGLIGAGIFTRNLDAPKVPVKAAVGSATAIDGRATATYGFAGSW
jgi:hypothetical protein